MSEQKYVKEEVLDRYYEFMREFRVEESVEMKAALASIRGKGDDILTLNKIAKQLSNTCPGYTIYPDDRLTRRYWGCEPLLGQEAITPRGMGRVSQILCDSEGEITEIHVRMYSDDVALAFIPKDVELLDPRK